MKKVLGLFTMLLIIAVVAVGSYVAYLFFQGEFGPLSRSPKLTLKKFGAASREFSAKNSTSTFWESGTTKFEPYFSHLSVRGAYQYYYFSDDDNNDGRQEGTKFVYAAFPIRGMGKNSAYFVDENLNFFTVTNLDDTGILLLTDLAQKGVNMHLPSGAENPSRCKTDLFDFTLVSRLK